MTRLGFHTIHFSPLFGGSVPPFEVIRIAADVGFEAIGLDLPSVQAHGSTAFVRAAIRDAGLICSDVLVLLAGARRRSAVGRPLARTARGVDRRRVLHRGGCGPATVGRARRLARRLRRHPRRPRLPAGRRVAGQGGLPLVEIVAAVASTGWAGVVSTEVLSAELRGTDPARAPATTYEAMSAARAGWRSTSAPTSPTG